jgi:cell division protein ZapA (FtsZ GTPase activity inhibitor)
MNRGLVVTIDGEQYRIQTDRDAEETLLEIQRLMRTGALDELQLLDGHRMIVHWGRVTAVSVSDDRGDELTYSAPAAEPHWPQRPF